MAERTNLDWNDLRYFLAAARERTLSGAARLLGVKHSTIGRQNLGPRTVAGRTALRPPTRRPRRRSTKTSVSSPAQSIASNGSSLGRCS